MESNRNCGGGLPCVSPTNNEKPSKTSNMQKSNQLLYSKDRVDETAIVIVSHVMF